MTLTTMLATAALLTAGACGGDDEGGLSSGGSDTTEPGDSDTTDTADKGTVAMSGQNFTEMQIMAEMYRQVLEADGYTVDVNLVGTRDLYIKGLGNGQIDVVPEYLAGIADQLNGTDVPFTTNDPQQALSEAEPIVSEAGITLLEPSDATDQNAFFVTEDFAQENNVETLSDMAGVGEVTLAAIADCEGRGDCEGGLTDVYGIDIVRILDTGFGSQQTKDSVLDGESQLGETGTTDASLSELGLMLLEDDKGIQPAQNLIPAVNTDFLTENPDVEAVLNEVSATLTTEDLAGLNAQVDIDREKAADVAEAYLTDNGLI